MLFLNKNSNKTIAYKKEYFIQKIEITPKRLQIGMLIKMALKFNFTFISSIRNGSYHLKK
jgi:hypothetical protein